MTLNQLGIGKSAIVKAVGGSGSLRQHFLDMGLIPGAEVTLEKLAPMGDPMELQIHGYELTLRLADAAQIEISPISERSKQHLNIETISLSDHPGLGEGGKFHARGDGDPLPSGTTLSFALVGNRTAARPRCLTALPVQTSMSEISPV